MLSCPQCNSTRSVFLRSESTRCCADCGTLLEVEPFVYEDDPQEAQHTVRNVSSQYKRPAQEPAFLSFLRRVAIYYKMPEDLIQRAHRIYHQHLTTKINMKYKNETAICIIFIASGSVWNNTWSLLDFARHFYAPVDMRRTYIIYRSVMAETPMARSINSKTPYEDAKNLVPRMYSLLLKDIILKEDYAKLGKSKQGASAVNFLIPLDELRSTTLALINLGDMYMLNTGKHCRPIVIAAAFIAGLSVYVKHRPTRIKHSKKTTQNVKLSIKYICASKKFENYKEFLDERPASIRFRLNEYMGLLFLCSQQLPWLKSDESSQYVHYFVDDILQMFGSRRLDTQTQGNEHEQLQQTKPIMRLRDDEYMIPVMKAHNELYERRKQHLIKVQELMNDGKEPPAPTDNDDNSILLWCLFKLRRAGISEEDIMNYTEDAIRVQVASLEFREKLDASLSSPDEPIDMDSETISHNDMRDEELDLYLR